MISHKLIQSNTKPNLFSAMISKLFPPPVKTGVNAFSELTDSLYVVPNHISFKNLADFPERIAFVILETGGGDIDASAAFELVTKDSLIAYLEPLKERNLKIVLPAPYATRWKIGAGEKLNDCQVQVIDKFPEDLPDLRQVKFGQTNSMLLIRVIYTLKLWFAQSIFFIIPLLIFGFKQALIGLGVLLFSGLLNAVLWDFMPVSRNFKGLGIGVILVLMISAVFLIFFQKFIMVGVLLGLMVYLGCAWMGVVINGIRR